MLEFNRTGDTVLNSRQQENYNFHHLAVVLAEYGFNSIRLSDDYNGADFLAIHVGSPDDPSPGRNDVLKVQLKGRLSFAREYKNKSLYIAFPCDRNANSWYLYDHDQLLEYFEPNFHRTDSWLGKIGKYSYRSLGKESQAKLRKGIEDNIVWILEMNCPKKKLK